MGRRLELQSKLEELLGSKEVYYNRPEDRLMKYPAIVYSKGLPNVKHASNEVYQLTNRYDITVIHNRPDHPVVDKLLRLPLCSQDRTYKADNLYHDTFTLYF